LPGADLTRKTARNNLAQQCMKLVDHLGAQPGQMPAPTDPHPHHRGVILDHNPPKASRTQPDDGHRPGIMRIGLATRIGGKQPHSSSKLGLHTNHVLAGAGKLLRQQISQILRVLYRQIRCGHRPARSPPQPSHTSPLARAEKDDRDGQI
jgi:hypothetical protein